MDHPTSYALRRGSRGLPMVKVPGARADLLLASHGHLRGGGGRDQRAAGEDERLWHWR